MRRQVLPLVLPLSDLRGREGGRERGREGGREGGCQHVKLAGCMPALLLLFVLLLPAAALGGVRDWVLRQERHAEID
jgi:hypothetical protein